MTRQKVKLSFIVEKAKRKETYKKKKRGFLKELKELTTLYGVQACAVISSEFESEPVFWPSKLGVESLYGQFKKMPIKQTKNMLNVESVVKQRIAKVEESTEKQVEGNREREMTFLMYDLLAGKSGLENLNAQDLYDLKQVIEKTKQYFGQIIQALKQMVQTKCQQALIMMLELWLEDQQRIRI